MLKKSSHISILIRLCYVFHPGDVTRSTPGVTKAQLLASCGYESGPGYRNERQRSRERNLRVVLATIRSLSLSRYFLFHAPVPFLTSVHTHSGRRAWHVKHTET